MRLRAAQERASDIKAELDELRAQRAYEERERVARRREKEEQEKALHTALLALLLGPCPVRIPRL